MHIQTKRKKKLLKLIYKNIENFIFTLNFEELIIDIILYLYDSTKRLKLEFVKVALLYSSKNTLRKCIYIYIYIYN
jgi:HJR/Mrr/RecB family endonuclease